MGDRWNFSAKKKYQEILDPGIYFPMVFTIFFLPVDLGWQSR